MPRKPRSKAMPVSSLKDLNGDTVPQPGPENGDNVQAADGNFYDKDVVEVDDTKGLNEDPFRTDVTLNESDENPHTEQHEGVGGDEEVVDIQPDAPRVPRTGEVNPEPENDAEDIQNRITKEANLLNSEASDKYSNGYDPTFTRQIHEVTGVGEVVLKRTGEAIGCDVGQAQFRTYTQARGTLTDWEYAQLLQYIAPREIVTGL